MLHTTEPGCEEVLALLEPYLDGQLPPAEAATVARHLASCEDCRAELAWAGEVLGTLRGLPEVSPPPVLLARVLDRASHAGPERSPERHRRQARWRAPLGIAAMLALTAGSALVLWPHRRPGPEEVAHATREARYALAYVGAVSQQAGRDLRDDVLRRRLVLPVARGLLEPGREGGRLDLGVPHHGEPDPRKGV